MVQHMMSDGNNKTFSALQHLLTLAYSAEDEDQEVAARDLAKLVEGVTFPSVSFGPLAHALCRLVSSSNLDVTTHAARAIKLLILDDALRPQANVAGVVVVICDAVKQWEDEAKCLTELLGALQTLSWDKSSVRSVLQAGIVKHLADYVQASDQEVSVLALSTIGNILSYSDSLLLQDTHTISELSQILPTLLEICRTANERPQCFYSGAAIANATSHPTLASRLLQENGLEVCRELSHQASSHLHILGSRLGDCSQTALHNLTAGREGASSRAGAKYRFKWGTKPAMQLGLVSAERHGRVIAACLVLWVCLIMYTLSPFLLG